MGKPAATISHMHVCPKVTSKVPHVGGPVVTGSANVFIGGKPAARVGDTLVCIGPPDKIKAGSSGVKINGKPAARLGDSTAHGGKIVVGEATVMVGEKASASGVPAKVAEVVISQLFKPKTSSKIPVLAIAKQLRLDTQLVAFFKEAASGDIVAAAKNLVDQVAKKINAVDILGAVARSQGINIPNTEDVINGELGKIFQTGCMQPGGIFNGKPLPDNIFDVVDTVGPMLGVDMKKYAAIKGVANLNFDQVNVKSIFKAVKTIAPLFDVEVNDLGKILGKDYQKVLQYYGKLQQYGDEVFGGDFFKSLPNLPSSMDDVLASADIPPYNFVMPEGEHAEDEALTDEFMDELVDDMEDDLSDEFLDELVNDIEDDPFSEYLDYLDTGEWDSSKISEEANDMIGEHVTDDIMDRSNVSNQDLMVADTPLWKDRKTGRYVRDEKYREGLIPINSRAKLIYSQRDRNSTNQNGINAADPDFVKNNANNQHSHPKNTSRTPSQSYTPVQSSNNDIYQPNRDPYGVKTVTKNAACFGEDVVNVVSELPAGGKAVERIGDAKTANDVANDIYGDDGKTLGHDCGPTARNPELSDIKSISDVPDYLGDKAEYIIEEGKDAGEAIKKFAEWDPLENKR